MKARTRFALAGFAVAIVLGLLSAPLAADAQQPRKDARIGILCVGICPLLPLGVGPNDTAFVQGLREAGYIDGQNLSVDVRGIGSSYDQLPALVAGLVQRRVDVIVAIGSPASAQAAKNATSTIPIVMVGVADAVELKLVASLGRPGGNVTGLAVPFAQLATKQLEFLKQADPRLSRVAVLWNPAAPPGGPGVKQIEVAARSLGVQVQPVEVRSSSDFEGGILRNHPATGQWALCNGGPNFLGSTRGDCAVRTAERHADNFLVPRICRGGWSADVRAEWS